MFVSQLPFVCVFTEADKLLVRLTEQVVTRLTLKPILPLGKSPAVFATSLARAAWAVNNDASQAS